MGWVREDTEDNDSEWQPKAQARYHLYCDRCGSFDMQDWFADPDGERLQSQRVSLERLENMGIGVLTLAVLGLIIWGITWFFHSQINWLGILLGLLCGGSFFWLMLISASMRRLKGRLETLGIICGSCGATYSHGSSVLMDQSHNPRGLTADDVPKTAIPSPSEPPEP